MAGIGFNLQKILEKDTYFSSFKAYFYSSMISAGPWILSMLTLFSLSYFSPRNISIYEIVYFKALVIYTFAFSLIVTGIFQFPITRYLADRLYLGERDAVVPVFNASALLILVFQFAVGGAYVIASGENVRLNLLALLVYLAVSMIWLAMVFLTALKDYRVIVISYAAGSAIAVGASLKLGAVYGLEGYLIGYLIGHLVIVGLWTARIFVEFESPRIIDFQLFPFVLKHRVLVLTGFFYALAIWADKIVFWLSPHATQVAPLIRICPLYDFASFLAYLTVIPAISIFLIRIETDFYRYYRRYYFAIINKATFSIILNLKAQMMTSLRSSLSLLIRYQGIISLALIVFAPQIANFLKIPAIQIPIFRIMTVGAFLHSILLMTVLILLYFDFQKSALRAVLIFMVSNFVLTYATTRLGFPFFGYGYLFACLASLAVAFYTLDADLKRLEYLTFALQPIGVHREEEVM